MPEVTFKVLDAESVADPEVLLEVITDLLQHQRVLQGALGMVTALVLYRFDALQPEDEGTVERTIGTLKEFLAMAKEGSRTGLLADQLRDLLEAEE